MQFEEATANEATSNESHQEVKQIMKQENMVKADRSIR